MTDLPRDAARGLEERCPFSTLTVEHEAHARDGTVKALFRTADGRPVEAVLMRYRDGRRSLCLSSQSGCPLTCTFCATGQMRFGRNLTASEILDQALHFRRIGRGRPRRVHGHGRADDEPRQRARRLPRLPDIGITHRRTAISTVGWIPGIERLAEDRCRCGWRCRCTPPTRAALGADAGQRPLPARRRDRRLRAPSTSASAARCSSST